ncbi:histidine phosphatase family protein [Microlunatus flavus]|uniref:Probable phosphoglycerate mutase n=1 Tax=Microlunatus flavus TaxID=1036181 RepID=A0A1H9G3K7_9ACTN|nr:histidine phosphatase family protein [Microlunatus flavus]SEQ44707.1 probable phosphoglycerate mutase [Microlunatus flavus]
MRLLLIRHGQTTANVRGALDTAFPGEPLTDLGRAQAAAVPAALEDEDVTAVYASNLTRTRRTAEPLRAARGLRVGIRPGLAEVRAGDLELRADEVAVRGYVDCLVAWMGGDLDRRMPGGADGHAFWARYDGALTAIAERHSGRTVAVFSHGAAIRVWTALATRMALERAEQLHVANTGMAVLEHRPGRGWDLERWSTDPVGGAHLLDTRARDVTGDSVDDVEAATQAEGRPSR